jgi:NAD(P)-dependent dehydrogenase (short-subunit alcohol dehydrogenase family)
MKDPYTLKEEFIALEPDVEALGEEEIDRCLRTLRAVIALPFEHPWRRRVEVSCSVVRRSSRKARKQAKKEAARARDAEVLGETGIRELAEDLVAKREHVLPASQQDYTVGTLEKPRACYVCKEPFTELHFFYDRMCPRCAPLHYAKRFQRADLTGRRFILTGGRIKIGFEVGLKMLRDGAEMIVTTRFPQDAARRYAEAEDFHEWSDRLHIYGLELRHVPQLEAFCEHMIERFDHLDGIVHNAAQTVRRPDAYYADVLTYERELAGSLPEDVRRVIHNFAEEQKHLLEDEPEVGEKPRTLEAHELLFPDEIPRDEALFPSRQRDEDGLQLDLRDKNSWMLKLHEVDALELVEVHLVNAVAPYILNARLKPLILRCPREDRYVVHVAAKEGQFEVNYKSYRHPHTNMAKAGLNMLTRTSAEDWARDGIYMNSADTGWVTYEQPQHIKREWLDVNDGPPLDVIDGAARIYDPIVRGIRDEDFEFGKLYVNYEVAPW